MAFIVPLVPPKGSVSTLTRYHVRRDVSSSRTRTVVMATESEEQRRPRRVRRREHGMNVVTRAQKLVRHGEQNRAANLLRSYLCKQPNNARAWLALAKMERNDDDAFATFSEATMNCPESTHLLHAWAVRCGRAGHLQEARKLFRSCLHLSPNDALVWQAYALLEERAGDVELARSLFTFGVGRVPKCADLWSAWGALERRQKQHKIAIKYLTAANSINPKHIKSLQMLGLSLEAIGKNTSAKSYFEAALNVDPQSVPTLQAYALFTARQGDIERARELFAEAARLDPRHAPVFHAWATMERNIGDTERARELFDAGVRGRPYSVPILRGWADMELELGHIDSGPEWQLNGDGSTRTRRSLGENLHMLRMLLERRSNEDVATVMKWLDRRANEDRNLYDRISERGTSDSRLIKDWLKRRSEEDVEAFKEWMTARYERDRQIGTFILNLDIPPLQQSTSNEIAEPMMAQSAPREWYMLKEMPTETLRATDESIYYGGKARARDYAEGMYLLSMIANNFADRSAIVFILGSLSLMLVAMSVELENTGYTPAGEKAQETVQQQDVEERSGVDAYLYENAPDDMINTAGGTLKKIRK